MIYANAKPYAGGGSLLNKLLEKVTFLEEENESLKERLQELEDTFDERVANVIDNYNFRTVCKYDIRGTGNIKIVAASSLDE